MRGDQFFALRIGFLAVVPWIRALMWAFKPTDVIDVRHLPGETKRDIDAMIARLTESAPAKKGPETRTRVGGRKANRRYAALLRGRVKVTLIAKSALTEATRLYGGFNESRPQISAISTRGADQSASPAFVERLTANTVARPLY